MKNEIIFDVPDVKMCGLWCAATGDAELARAADATLARGLGHICVAADAVGRVWAWLEKTPVRIVTRLYLRPATPRGKITVADISDLAVKISGAFKSGATGAQVFVRHSDIERFAAEIAPVRDDLFFNREFSIGVDICDVDCDEWTGLLNALGRVRADALLIVMPTDAGDKSDFVGRLYALLDAWGGAQYGGALHFALNTPARVEQAWRLVQKMRPELAEKIRFFVR